MFIVFEGIDGCGKTTIMKESYKYYKRLYGSKVLMTKSIPDDGMSRKFLAGEDVGIRSNLDSAKMFLQDMVNLNPSILEYHNAGYVILCDRWYISTIVYDGITASDTDHIIDMVEANRIIKPDLTVYIDIDPNVSIMRIEERGDDKEIYETLPELNRVKTGYDSLFRRKDLNRVTKDLLIIPSSFTKEAMVEELVKYTYNNYGI